MKCDLGIQKHIKQMMLLLLYLYFALGLIITEHWDKKRITQIDVCYVNYTSLKIEGTWNFPFSLLQLQKSAALQSRNFMTCKCREITWFCFLSVLPRWIFHRLNTMHSSFLIKDTSVYLGVVLHSEMCPVACKALYIFKIILTCFSYNSLNVTSCRVWSTYLLLWVSASSHFILGY